MSDLTDLYQEVILDHNRKPRNFRVLENANRQAEGRNPLCGDVLTVFLDVEGDRIQDVSFQGSGCAISKASASLMTTALKGKTVAEARDLFDRFRELATGDSGAQPKLEGLGKLAAFSGIRGFPSRVKCAVLGWHTMRAALDQREAVVSTE